MTPRLLAMLRFFKGDEEFTSWRQIPQFLASEYHHDMTFRDVLGHLVEAYIEVMNEPRFCVSSHANGFHSILMSPVSGFHSVLPADQISLESMVSIEDFYRSIVFKIRDVIAYQTKIDWCRHEIYPDDSDRP